ncbi:MAG TPA: tetratricopeptide repeat protein, partial [Flavobacteriales bacterium]|nr:tetratricopeptide repeat protein [Flavobacteriales bacterium]
YNDISSSFRNMGQADSALKYISYGLEVNRNVAMSKDPKAAASGKFGVGVNYCCMGIVYENQGNYPLAVEYYFKSMKIHNELVKSAVPLARKKASEALATVYTNLGGVFQSNGDYKKALTYNYKALSLYIKHGHVRYEALMYSNIGNAYKALKNLDKAIESYKKGIVVANNGGLFADAGYISGNLGSIYKEAGDSLCKIGQMKKAFDSLYPLARQFIDTAYAVSSRFDSWRESAVWLGIMGDMYTSYGDFAKAESYLARALEYASKGGDKGSIRDIYAFLFRLYEQKGDWEKAFVFHTSYVNIRDSLLNIESLNEISRKEINFEYSKKAAADSLKAVERKRMGETLLHKARMQKYFLFTGLGLLLMFGIFMLDR